MAKPLLSDGFIIQEKCGKCFFTTIHSVIKVQIYTAKGLRGFDALIIITKIL